MKPLPRWMHVVGAAGVVLLLLALLPSYYAGTLAVGLFLLGLERVWTLELDPHRHDAPAPVPVFTTTPVVSSVAGALDGDEGYTVALRLDEPAYRVRTPEGRIVDVEKYRVHARAAMLCPGQDAGAGESWQAAVRYAAIALAQRDTPTAIARSVEPCVPHGRP